MIDWDKLEEASINWSSLVANFQRKRIGVAELALKANVTPQEISDLLHERILEPAFMSGLRLLAVHSDYFPERHRQLLEE